MKPETTSFWNSSQFELISCENYILYYPAFFVITKPDMNAQLPITIFQI